MRRAARKDRNQDEIVKGLRDAGIKVRVLNNPDLPDLLCGFIGNIHLLEIKDGSRKPSERRLRPGQQRFADEWHGYSVHKVESLDEALRAIGATSTTRTI